MRHEGKPENGARVVGRWVLHFLGPALLAAASAGAAAYVGVRVQVARLEARFEERTDAMREDIRDLRSADRDFARQIEELRK